MSCDASADASSERKILRKTSCLHCWNSHIFLYEDDVDQMINMLAKDLSRLDVNYAIIGGNVWGVFWAKNHL